MQHPSPPTISFLAAHSTSLKRREPRFVACLGKNITKQLIEEISSWGIIGCSESKHLAHMCHMYKMQGQQPFEAHRNISGALTPGHLPSLPPLRWNQYFHLDIASSDTGCAPCWFVVQEFSEMNHTLGGAMENFGQPYWRTVAFTTLHPTQPKPTHVGQKNRN